MPGRVLRQAFMVPCAAPLGSNPARRRLLREFAGESRVERRIGIAGTIVGCDEERCRDCERARPEEACLMNAGYRAKSAGTAAPDASCAAVPRHRPPQEGNPQDLQRQTDRHRRVQPAADAMPRS